MIIQCPACATRYVVPDSAIGVEGRTVRCAKCRHSWYQDSAELVLSDEKPETVTDEEAGYGPDPVFAPESPPPPAPVGEARYAKSEPSQFDAAPPFRRRVNPLKMWSWAAGIFAVVAAGLILAVSFFGLPDWVPVSRPTFAAAQPDLQLDFPAERQERRQLPNGKEFFAASGSITNIGTAARRMPTILIVLRDARDRIVFSWEVPPPQRSIAPGESVVIDEAVTDIPRSAKFAEIGWKPE